MRRRSLGVIDRDEVLRELTSEADGHDPDFLIRVLEPLVLDQRRNRILDVANKRLASVTVVFDAPHDPFNGAAVIRTCEAFGVHDIHVVERRESFLVAGSVTRNAHKWIDLHSYTNGQSAVSALRDGGMTLVAAHAEGKLLPEDLTKIPRLAVVLGNERDGIAQDLAAACDETVRVPMRGMVESLNVSVTAAVLLAYATANRAGDLDTARKRRLYARGLYFSVQRAKDVLNVALKVP